MYVCMYVCRCYVYLPSTMFLYKVILLWYYINVGIVLNECYCIMFLDSIIILWYYMNVIILCFFMI
jgi:hypothetical protein